MNSRKEARKKVWSVTEEEVLKLGVVTRAKLSEVEVKDVDYPSSELPRVVLEQLRAIDRAIDCKAGDQKGRRRFLTHLQVLTSQLLFKQPKTRKSVLERDTMN